MLAAARRQIETPKAKPIKMKCKWNKKRRSERPLKIQKKKTKKKKNREKRNNFLSSKKCVFKWKKIVLGYIVYTYRRVVEKGFSCEYTEKVDAVKMSILQWQEIYWTGVLQACHVPYTVRSRSSPQPTSLFHYKSIREKDTYQMWAATYTTHKSCSANFF